MSKTWREYILRTLQEKEKQGITRFYTRSDFYDPIESKFTDECFELDLDEDGGWIWEHRVRGDQTTMKRQGLIDYDEDCKCWRLL